jgi:hypothetical protein
MRLADERLRDVGRDARQCDAQIDFEPEALADGSDADFGRDPRLAHVDLLLRGDALERAVKARRVTGREQLLRVGGSALAAEFLGHRDLEIQDTVRGPHAAFASADGRRGSRIENAHRLKIYSSRPVTATGRAKWFLRGKGSSSTGLQCAS